ncbi:MAG: D-alanyl-D-alanine carboxypeptidase family protein [Synergistaceae bacterium]|jgi:D-alanyl-D-alanine dipeptidase|nr:D-alanyl-D-alanine carboxypeptidase family protein [Synergistaceae bacterium]
MNPVTERNIKQRRIISCDERRAVLPGASAEPMTDVRKYDPGIIAEQRDDMIPYTGGVILVRDTLAVKLAGVSAKLSAMGYRLKLRYGYRHPDVQEKYFESSRARLRDENPNFSEEELNRKADIFTALPEVAGHPTGGAVDVTIVESASGRELDMGLIYGSDEEHMKTFSGAVNSEQRKNRLLLHDIMVSEGFAPFYGEWWHFMYGDREWAAFTGEKSAIYGPVRIDEWRSSD